MDAPFLSVLMPALNEERTISRVLDAVLSSPVDLELVIVDDGSTDRT
jgi:glycosyltransferase involved in cell wall biosynthesis